MAYNSNHITSTIVSASISPEGKKLITLVATYPRFIHSQIMTHRVFSRNSASSRAIPTRTLIDTVKHTHWYPLFMKNKSGMAAEEVVENEESCNMIWASQKRSAIDHAERLAREGVHKQDVNRLLEPFALTTTLISATEWDNFFKLRLHHSSQQEIVILAERMKESIDNASFKFVGIGGWHLPFIKDDEKVRYSLEECKKISAARCARVSYTSHFSTKEFKDDINLATRLAHDGHYSPFEHIATPYQGDTMSNFKGWKQYRSYLNV